MSVAAWSRGIDSEARFWDEWASTKGSRWPEDFLARQQADRRINAYLESMLPPGGRGRVLDVGSGPLTLLGTESAMGKVDVVPVDPLADLYRCIIERHALIAPVPTIFANAEDLSAFFNSNAFDVVHCQNALDHSFDPVRGIEEMLRVVKVGGHVVLSHLRNEAENQAYVGFHQFNFDRIDGRFCVWNTTSKVFPQDVIACLAEYTASISQDDRAISLVIRKTGDFADSMMAGRFRDRVRDLTEGMVSHFVGRALDALKVRVALPEPDVGRSS
jgi:SAM-dependent methyltransferase